MSWRWPWQRERGPEPRWVVVDVEATGLDASSDHLLAIAAVAARPGGHGLEISVADSFEVVLEHGGPVDKANILVHGIGIGAQRQGADPASALRDFLAWVDTAPLVGFHVAFDRQMIERAHRSLLGTRLNHRWLDVGHLAAALQPEVKARALDDWLAHWRIPCLRRHQAAADALATAELLQCLWPRVLAEAGADFSAIESLADRHRWVPRAG